MENFWGTIIYYNTSTWVVQYLIAAVAFVLTSLLLRKSVKPWVKMAMKIFMMLLYMWIAIFYYLASYDYSNHYDVMAVFWGIMAATWLWDAITGYSTFRRTHKYDAVAYLLLAMPIVYPLISLARGLVFPEITSVVMPSSVVVFTLGILLLFACKVNLLLILFLCHWSLIGLTKTFVYEIPEDFLLALSALPALYILFRENFLPDLTVETKPSAKHINYLLIAIFAGLAIILTSAMVYSALA